MNRRPPRSTRRSSDLSFSVLGLHTQINVTNSEGANDRLAVESLGGNDTITATTLPAGIVKLTIDARSEEHTSELQSLAYLVCRPLPEKKTSHARSRNK